MSEIISASAREPYIKNRLDKEQQRQIEKRNAQISRALEGVRNEPPSTWHAPRGYQSLKGPSMQQGKKKGTMPGTQHYVDVPAWPPSSAPHSLRDKEQREISIENERMKKKLQVLNLQQSPEYSNSALSRWLN
jgi:hypothetical protein